MRRAIIKYYFGMLTSFKVYDVSLISEDKVSTQNLGEIGSKIYLGNMKIY